MDGRKGNAKENPNYKAHCLEGSGKTKMKKGWQHEKWSLKHRQQGSEEDCYDQRRLEESPWRGVGST
jgi:hypothetical protein